MEITKITAQARNSHKVNIFIDGQFNLSLSLAQLNQLGLKVGQQLQPEYFKMLKSESLFGKYYGMALDFLAKRARSESEMRRFVIAKSSKNRVIKKRSGEIIKLKAEISADEAESLSAKIITHLKNKKYLNDVEFAGSWLKSVAHRNYSSLKLKNELVKKGINSEIIDQVTAEISGDEHQTKTLKKLVAKLKTKTRYQDDLKLKRYLVGRGFDYSLVKEVVDDNEAEVS
jgi:regulatory protein